MAGMESLPDLTGLGSLAELADLPPYEQYARIWQKYTDSQKMKTMMRLSSLHSS
jgi:hypothetical protein